MNKPNKPRRSSQINKQSIKIIQQALDKFTSKSFLTSNTLFNNLLSSQQLKIDLSSHQFLKTAFGTKTLLQKDLFQFCYFHRYEKKLILYNFLKTFLSTTTKTQLLLMLNGQKLDNLQLNKFLSDIKLQQQFKKRIIIYHNINVNTFIFNLQWLGHVMKERQFLKGLIICDINSFQSSDKTSGQKYYKKISKQLFILSFRKDFYQFKVMQKSSLSYFSDQHQQIQEINQKIIHYLHKKYQFNYNPCLIIPLQYICENLKNLNQTYKSVLLRSNGTNDHIQEVIFSSNPFKIQSVREL